MKLRIRFSFLGIGICGFFWPEATAERLADTIVRNLI